MFLPYASDFLVTLAEASVSTSCFASNITDQFLTQLAMENMSDYDGDGDFGSLTRIDLDDELSVVLTVLDGIAWTVERTEGIADERLIDTLRSHYAGNAVLLGWGGDQKWWADWFLYSVEEADAAQEQFAKDYSEFLGDED